MFRHAIKPRNKPFIIYMTTTYGVAGSIMLYRSFTNKCKQTIDDNFIYTSMYVGNLS